MSIFTEVKEQLKLRDVAEYYGLHINRAGFTNCPFHQERTPSMKLYDDHFYCFGCQSSGDAITLVEKLFGLQPLDAAKKIQNDFGLAEVSYDYKKEASMYRERQKSIRKELELKKWKAATLSDSYRLLLPASQMERGICTKKLRRTLASAVRGEFAGTGQNGVLLRLVPIWYG